MNITYRSDMTAALVAYEDSWRHACTALITHPKDLHEVYQQDRLAQKRRRRCSPITRWHASLPEEEDDYILWGLMVPIFWLSATVVVPPNVLLMSNAEDLLWLWAALTVLHVVIGWDIVHHLLIWRSRQKTKQIAERDGVEVTWATTCSSKDHALDVQRTQKEFLETLDTQTTTQLHQLETMGHDHKMIRREIEEMAEDHWEEVVDRRQQRGARALKAIHSLQSERSSHSNTSGLDELDEQWENELRLSTW